MDRLPRGRHGLPPEFVARNQRDRLISALILTLAEAGYKNTTVSMIGRRAAVSKSDFYKHFDSKDECFLAAYDTAVDRVRAGVLGACAATGSADWPDRVRAGVVALLGLFAAEPPLAAIVLAEGLCAGSRVHDRYQAAVESFVPLLRDGAPEPPDGDPVPPAIDEAVVGGIASLIARRVIAGEAAGLVELAPDLLEFALTPHLGTERTRRITSAG
ncbi:MAG TPA: TetR/AcrR family transcriptional regulator [Solirubrobacterales bacterium]|jgi:AcrR family transcriptional regulator|nr:TetR/AcrR family transcriptional regulator [Solirubrobacterales bacterium]